MKKRKFAQKHMCCLPADTSLIWATSSQRNLWHLKMTKIVTNLWSPLKKYKIMLPLSPDLGPGQPKSCFRYRVQTKDLWLLLFGCSIFQRRCDRDRRIWNGRDPPSCIRQPVYTRCYTMEQHRKTPYDTMWPCIWDPHHEWPFFPRNHKAISFCSNLTRTSTGVSSYCSNIFSAQKSWLLRFPFNVEAMLCLVALICQQELWHLTRLQTGASSNFIPSPLRPLQPLY